MPLSVQHNRAFNKYFRMFADAMSAAGIDKRIVIEVPWTFEGVRELAKELSKQMYGKYSLADLEPNEVDFIYDVLNNYSSSRGIHIPFPNQESLQNEITTV